MELVLLEARDRVEERTRLLAGAGASHDLAIARDDIVETAQLGVEREAWGWERRARELLARAFHVIAIDVRVGEDVNELVRDESRELRDEVQEHGVLGDVERHAEEKIAGALIHHHAQLSVGDEELEERVARRHARPIDLAGGPRRD